ncbi:hypothetical protein BD410DRAFT_713892 [Rickenella mellea]|uniref:Blue (type 1) copper domain-containing protein n=1 Tax=Rickenella mellea TaxID=50990 RepID=A0A4Y7QK43_9AGAM|nr:hypothetical protein BD410DRAFT_713892 [Rickenella mellea]
MHFSSAISLLAIPALVAAQGYGPAPGPASGSSTSAAAAAVPSAPPSTSSQINIDVAAGEKLIFNPANVTAANGTTVTFYFPNNGLTHSVTQSSFAAPCAYLAANATASTPGGFDSGLTMGTQFTITITNDQKPIWFHCKQVGHCGQGMVGSINAPANGTNTFSAFQAAAMAIGSSETQESDSGPVTGGVNGVASASPANTASAAAAAKTTPSSGKRCN